MTDRLRTAALMIIVVILTGAAVILAQDKAEELNQLKAAEQEEREILAQLDSAERQMVDLEDRLALIDREAAQVRRQLTEGDNEIKEAEKQIKSLKKYLIRRLRAMYRFRERDLLQVLLDSDSLAEMLQRFRYLSIIMHSDQTALSQFGQQMAEVKTRQARLKAEQSRLYQLRLDYSRQKEKLDVVRRQKTNLLMRVHQRKELYQALLNSREESRQRLIKEVIIEPLDKSGAPAASDTKTRPAESPRKWPDFSALRGRLARPLQGELSGRFGKTSGPFNTFYTRHGWVFRAEAGVEVKAILEGEVLYIGWIRGIGNIIILNHGRRYYTLSGGLVGIRPKAGDWVRQGQILGVVPESGQEEKKEIYFEIRQGGQALDPAAWLSEKTVN